MKLIIPKPWMKQALICAALFHLLLGVVLILFPDSFYLLHQLPDRANPYLWKLAGGILIILGFTFLFVLPRPFIQWPAIFMGMTANVLSLFFICYAYSRGETTPLVCILTAGINLLWIIPFAFILYGAFEYAQGTREACSYDLHKRKLKSLNSIQTNQGTNLQELSDKSPVMLIFLRHLGCPFCQEALSDIAQNREDIEQSGTKIVLIHMATDEYAEKMTAKYDLHDLPRIGDSERKLYRAFGLTCGRLFQLFGLPVWIRAVSAAFKGYISGRSAGNRSQMPGIFLIYKGMILQAFRHSTAADRPDYTDLARPDFTD